MRYLGALETDGVANLSTLGNTKRTASTHSLLMLTKTCRPVRRELWCLIGAMVSFSTTETYHSMESWSCL